MNACEHDWRWLPRPVYTIGVVGSLSTCSNVQCTRCGMQSWAHGRMPDARPIVSATTPTTGRS